mgnify:CR=1 FL=1
MKMLMEDIKNKQFKNIYLLTGEEVYLRMQYRKKLKEALVEDGDTIPTLQKKLIEKLQEG